MKLKNPCCQAILDRTELIESVIRDMKGVASTFPGVKCNISFLELEQAVSDFQKQLEEYSDKKNFTSDMFRGEET